MSTTDKDRSIDLRKATTLVEQRGEWLNYGDCIYAATCIGNVVLRIGIGLAFFNETIEELHKQSLFVTGRHNSSGAHTRLTSDIAHSCRLETPFME